MTAQPPGPSGANPATDAGQSARAHGFPSPARDYLDGGIDLNRELVRDRTSTFLMRVTGQALAASGIHDGDEIVVDRAGTPRHGSVVVVVFEGELLVRRLALQTRDGVRHAALETDDGAAPREVGDLQVWGVATYCLHRL
ncbi:S24 family peptidase [Citricoccus sp. I39-566]|uniref:LexA family protein n=1 Tax=Citricoccus sp. I39-566 TaxID=3073268 RepID=UPI00286D18E4|nr:S24 family peptidase [Citricoccus sp. I39-566]WMY79282.1 S24 family peptidase [Citricoccus sp. I39-566]